MDENKFIDENDGRRFEMKRESKIRGLLQIVDFLRVLYRFV